MLFIRRKISFYERRWIFRRYLWSLKRESKRRREANEYEVAWMKALEEKRLSYQALLNIVKRWQARSRLQDRLESSGNAEVVESSSVDQPASPTSDKANTTSNTTDKGISTDV
jgi:hypothetical protein